MRIHRNRRECPGGRKRESRYREPKTFLTKSGRLPRAPFGRAPNIAPYEAASRIGIDVTLAAVVIPVHNGRGEERGWTLIASGANAVNPFVKKKPTKITRPTPSAHYYRLTTLIRFTRPRYAEKKRTIFASKTPARVSPPRHARSPGRWCTDRPAYSLSHRFREKRFLGPPRSSRESSATFRKRND